MDNKAIIKVKDLKKSFGNVHAIKKISLNIEKGNIIALLGPNGAGKTTTINVLTTQLQPDSGDVSILDFDIKKDSKKIRHKIGITFQETCVDMALTGQQILNFSGELYGMKRKDIKSRSKSLLEMVELTEAAKRKTKTYSGGMKRRIELARSLMNIPEILILDEPTLGLDPPSRVKIWEYIKTRNEEKGMTILLTTHYLEEAEKLADYVYIMDKGVIVEEGNPEDLIKKLGNNTIRLKGSGKLDDFKSALADKENIKSISISQNGIIYIGVTSGQNQLPEIFEIASQKQFIIREVEIDKPNLGDVFFNCTGNEIIESKGELK